MKLRVCHFPQVPCEPFIVKIENFKEAKKIFDVLADYDLFQYENNIKPDYSNATFLEAYNEETKEWESWYDEETGIDDLDEYLEYIEE